MEILIALTWWWLVAALYALPIWWFVRSELRIARSQDGEKL